MLHVGLKERSISLARGPHLYLFLPSPSLLSDVFPAQMEGVKLVINKVLSSHFQVLPLLRPLLTSPPCPSLGPLLHTLLQS